MGGTTVALAEGSAYTLFNPAAAAVRPSTSNDKFDWDWHFATLSPSAGSDIDNNGIGDDQSSSIAPAVNGGFLLQYRNFAIGLTLAIDTRDVPGGEVDRNSGGLLVAWSLLRRQLTLGLSLNVPSFSLAIRGNELFNTNSISLGTGAVWRPQNRHFRVGATMQTPVGGHEVQAKCDPENCRGFILPNRSDSPWQASAGLAYRFAKTPWNQKVRTRWRDERSVILAGDIGFAGSLENSFGIEAFTNQQLQPSGRDVGLIARLGAEYEWIPGYLRVRGGGYWEPSRFRDPTNSKVSGRVHLTLGAEGRIFNFRLFGKRYRAAISVAADVAKNYGNVVISPGLWH